VLIRREVPADVERIDEVHRRAFAASPDGSEPVEVGLVRALRADPAWVPALSLVAEVGAGVVAGHVVCSEGSVDGTAVVGLGPIGVLPDRQRRGIGVGLMHAVIAATDALGYPLVVLVGHLDYYRRFGFVPATRLGVLAPDRSWGDHFQARPLAAWTPAVHGPFRYAAPVEAI